MSAVLLSTKPDAEGHQLISGCLRDSSTPPFKSKARALKKVFCVCAPNDCVAAGVCSMALSQAETGLLTQEAATQLTQARLSMQQLTQGSSRLQACRWVGAVMVQKGCACV